MDLLENLNRQIAGWAAFYQYTDYTATVFVKLDRTVFWNRRLRWPGCQLVARQSIPTSVGITKRASKSHSAHAARLNTEKASDLRHKPVQDIRRTPCCCACGLSHPPAKQPVKREDQLDVCRGVGWLAPRHTGCTDFYVDELRLQVPVRDIQAPSFACGTTKRPNDPSQYNSGSTCPLWAVHRTSPKKSVCVPCCTVRTTRHASAACTASK